LRSETRIPSNVGALSIEEHGGDKSGGERGDDDRYADDGGEAGAGGY